MTNSTQFEQEGHTCRLAFTILKESSGGEHKFRVSQLIVLEDLPDQFVNKRFSSVVRGEFGGFAVQDSQAAAAVHGES